jgi:hypothetical protein
VWDLSLRAPVGPPLAAGTQRLEAASVGTVHGRAVLAAVHDDQLQVWDLRSGELAHHATAPVHTLATAIGPDARIYLVDGLGDLTAVAVPSRAVHPVARRHGLKIGSQRDTACPCRFDDFAVPTVESDALGLAAHYHRVTDLLYTVARDDAKWLSLLQCRMCGRHWAVDSLSAGHAEMYYIYPVHTQDPREWLNRAVSLRLPKNLPPRLSRPQ